MWPVALAGSACRNHRATEAFLFLERFERTVEPLTKVKVILEAHDQAANRFFNELFAGPSAASDAGIYAHHLIEENFTASQLQKEVAGLDTFLNLLRAFHIACNVSIKQLNDASSPLAPPEDAWSKWIKRLSKIFKAQSKAPDADRTGKSFVAFVWELQNCVPAECRRHSDSKTALAAALPSNPGELGPSI